MLYTVGFVVIRSTEESGSCKTFRGDKPVIKLNVRRRHSKNSAGIYM